MGLKLLKKSIYIYLKIIENKPVFNDIIYFPTNKNNYITYKKLITLFSLKNFAIISTNKDY